MFGNKKNGEEKKTIADGCLEEFQIAKEKGRVIIPIGSTGDAADAILAEVKENKEKYPYLKKYFDILENETDIDKIVNTVLEIAKAQRTVQ